MIPHEFRRGPFDTKACGRIFDADGSPIRPTADGRALPCGRPEREHQRSADDEKATSSNAGAARKGD
jgi:hypothetical protein